MLLFSLKNRLAILLIVFFMFANIHIVRAECDPIDPVAGIDPMVLIRCVMGEFGVEEEAVKENAKYINVASSKKTPPQVNLTFTPSNPVPGEKVTVSAQPLYFGNQLESLYYTWYLQPEICQGTTLSADNKALCDLNKDGDVDIEDFKIKAMRIYANNGFEWDSSGAYDTHTDSDGYSAVSGGEDQQGKSNHCFFFDTPSGQQIEFSNCFHLFPDTNNHGEVGDNSFSTTEENFWHTDPNNPDTAAIGHPDEANIAGLGAKDFSWTYQAGDQVGVVIEGVSVDATLEKDSSYKIMWAFLNGTCPESTLPDNINESQEKNKQYFNECLLKNMLEPTEGGGKNEKIEVNLSFSPTNPINDTSDDGDNADWINVVSTIGNSTKSESLNYSWNVYAGELADSDGNWGSPLLKSELIGVEQTTGAGIPNLNFKANFTDAPKYLKVKLNVSEKVTSGSGDGTRKGNAEVVIPLSSFDNKLSVFNTLVSDSLALSADTSVENPKEICKIYAATDPTVLVDAAICQVAPDEIVAVKANITPEIGETLADYDFLWTLNDQNLSYKYDPSFNNSTFKPNNLIFFPVLDPKGSTLNLSLVATNQKTGAKISLTKSFLVSEPTFKIISTDETTAKPKLLGNYIDLDGKEWPDYSQTEFWASNKENSAIKLSAEQFATSPLPLEEDLYLKWYLNDAVLGETSRTPSFNSLPVDAGSSFSLSAKGLYTQDVNTKKALRDYWDVSLDEYYEQQLSQKIDFTVTEAFDEVASAKNTRQKILASFISSVPAYFTFLFRIVMTAFVLLSAIWILFSLFPQTQKND